MAARRSSVRFSGKAVRYCTSVRIHNEEEEYDALEVDSSRLRESDDRQEMAHAKLSPYSFFRGNEV
jgi:hypothetical protein